MIDRDKPMYGREVAEACGWSPAMMTASKAAGYVFKYGSKTTIRHYLNWRAENPKFRITAYVLAHSKTRKAAKGLSQRRRDHPVETAHTLDAR